jgi:hypothetical protein
VAHPRHGSYRLDRDSRAWPTRGLVNPVEDRRLRLADTDGLKRVGEFREAARRLLRDADLTVEARERALLRPYDKGRREPFGDFIIKAVVEEICWGIERDDVDALRTVGDRMEREHRSLRNRGYQLCPECWTPLSTEVDWRHWKQLREGASAKFDAREGAVS